MEEYDGSIRIGTGIDTKGFDEDGKELEAKAKRLGKSLSDSTEVKAKVDSSGTKKELEKVADDISKEEKRIEELAQRAVEKTKAQYDSISRGIEEVRTGRPLETPGYDNNAVKQIQEYEEKVEESAQKARTTLLSAIADTKNKLKELSAQRFGPGDEEYDYAAQKLAEYMQELQAYTKGISEEVQKEIYGLDSIEGKIASVNQKISELSQMGFGIETPEMQEQLKLRAELLEIEKNIYKEATKTDAQKRTELEKQESRIKAIQAQEEAKRAKEVAAIQAQEAEEQRLGQIRASATVSDQNIIALLERRRQLTAEIADLERADVGLGYKEYEDKNKELEQINSQIKAYKASLSTVPEKFDKMRRSAKEAFNAMSEGTKNASNSLSNGLKMILKYGLGIRSMYILVSKIRTGIKNSFKNLMNYSEDFANSIQSVKNSLKTLGNQIAGVFRPVVEAVIPWINSLINALTSAMTKLAQFIAVLGGKSTFTKAKQIQDKYNQSLNGTAKAADKARGALAAFDDLDVLEKSDSGVDGGAEETLPKDMFEEVPIDNKLIGWLDELLARLNELKDIFAQGFWYGLGDWESRWESIKKNAVSIKDSLINIWTDPAVLSAQDKYYSSFSYMLGSVAGGAASIGLTIATNLVGGIAKCLEQNKDRIKEFVLSMFDIGDEINQIIAGFAQSFAFIFEAFGSESAQQLTANLIGIFVDAIMGTFEVLGKLARDILNIFIQPFVDNKEGFRTALEGFLGVLSEIAGTIKQGIDDTFDKLNEVYNEHFKPFFDSIAEGLSDTVEKFMEFWNTYVQPILEKWGAQFDSLWKEHLQPALNSFIELFGDLADFLKAKYEQFLKPLIDFIVQYILPGVVNAIDNVANEFFIVFGIIFDVVGGIIDVIGGIIQFLTGTFTGDWEKAWNGVVKIFDGIWGAIKGIINGIIGGVESMANSVVNAINAVIRALNGLSFEIPEFDVFGKKLGGTTIGFNIAEIPNVNIPRLANGAVIRGGNPFMAILGDQPAGKTNIEAPLDTIRQAVREELSGMNFGSTVSGQTKVVLSINGVDVGEAILDDLFSVMQRRGYDVDVLGVT